MNDGDIFEVPAHPGMHFRMHIEHDHDGGRPWENEDGHGPVRYAPKGEAKRPGERVLIEVDRGGGKWLYDWQEACKQARRDGWNAEPYDAPNRIERAVQADFDHLRRWLNDDWWYVGVRVGVVNAKGTPLTDTESLWGIESDSDDYIDEVARDLAVEAGNAYNAMPPSHEACIQWLEQHTDGFFNLDRITSVIGKGFSVAGSGETWYPTLREAIHTAMKGERE